MYVQTPRLHFLSFLVDTFDLRDMIDGNPRAKGEVKMCYTKVLSDMLINSSADVTRALRGCFSGGFVFVSFRLFVFVSFRFKTKEVLQCCRNVFFDILITSKGARQVLI